MIPHDKLMKILERRIKDQRFLRLIRKVLNTGYFCCFGEYMNDIVGTAQGSVISPILANIYLNELDNFVEELKNKFDVLYIRNLRTTEYNRMRYALRKAKAIEDPIIRRREVRRAAGSLLIRGSHFRTLKYIRYADDWIIAVHGSYKQAMEILDKIKEFCKSELGLEVSMEKTKITNSFVDKIRFLGTDIRHAKVRSYSVKKGILMRNRKPLLLSAPLNKIKEKLTKAGFIKNNRPITKGT